MGGVVCLNIVSSPGPGFVKVKARFGQVCDLVGLGQVWPVGDQVSQVKDQVGQGKGQELDICKNLHSDQVLFHLSLEIDPLNPALCCLLYGHSNQ